MISFGESLVNEILERNGPLDTNNVGLANNILSNITYYISFVIYMYSFPDRITMMSERQKKIK